MGIPKELNFLILGEKSLNKKELLEYCLGAMERFDQEKMQQLREELEGVALKDDVKNTVEGLIAGQSFLLERIERIIFSKGHERIREIQEIAKALGIDIKKNSPGEREMEKMMTLVKDAQKKIQN